MSWIIHVDMLRNNDVIITSNVVVVLLLRHESSGTADMLTFRNTAS